MHRAPMPDGRDEIIQVVWIIELLMGHYILPSGNLLQ